MDTNPKRNTEREEDSQPLTGGINWTIWIGPVRDGPAGLVPERCDIVLDASLTEGDVNVQPDQKSNEEPG